MKIQRKKIGDVVVLSVEGNGSEHSHGTDKFKSSLLDALDDESKGVVLNISSIAAVGAQVVETLLSLQKLVSGQRELVVGGIQQEALEFFRITKANRVLGLFPSESEAIAHLERQ